MSLELKPIGTVHSCYPDKFGTPRQPGLVPQASARIELFNWVQPKQSLIGLDEFSHLWVIFGFHKITQEKFKAKVHPPRLGGDSLGVFATRSPHRPAQLGLSLVKIEKVEAPNVFVSGVDIIDSSPVYDLKPYLPQVEALAEATGGWTDQVEERDQITVQWSPEQLQILSQWESHWGESHLQEIIENSLRLDPRPLVYRGFEGSEDSQYRAIHAMRLFKGDVHFRFTSPQTVEIVALKSL